MMQYVRKAKILLEVILPLVSIIVIIANIWIASKLSPIESRAIAIENNIKNINYQHEFIINNMVTKDEFNQVVTRIDKISSRVDEVISILLAKK